MNAGSTVPLCCNPTHLYDGDHCTNALDSVLAGTAVVLRPEWRKIRARGEASGQAKLTDEAVRDIRLRYAAGGVSQQKLANEYGVHQTKISYVISRKTWAHVH